MAVFRLVILFDLTISRVALIEPVENLGGRDCLLYAVHPRIT